MQILDNCQVLDGFTSKLLQKFAQVDETDRTSEVEACLSCPLVDPSPALRKHSLGTREPNPNRLQDSIRVHILSFLSEQTAKTHVTVTPRCCQLFGLRSWELCFLCKTATVARARNFGKCSELGG